MHRTWSTRHQRLSGKLRILNFEACSERLRPQLGHSLCPYTHRLEAHCCQPFAAVPYRRLSRSHHDSWHSLEYWEILLFRSSKWTPPACRQTANRTWPRLTNKHLALQHGNPHQVSVLTLIRFPAVFVYVSDQNPKKLELMK